MKAGIVAENKDNLVAVYEIIMRANGHTTETFTHAEFNPRTVTEQGLEFLVIEGRFAQHDGFAIATAKHVTVPVLYVGIECYRRMTQQEEERLKSFNIEVYKLIDLQQETGIENLIKRLKELAQ